MEALKILLYFILGITALQLLIHFLLRKRPVPSVFAITVAAPAVILWIMAVIQICIKPNGGEIIFAVLWSVMAMICSLVTLFIRLLCGWLAMAVRDVHSRCRKSGRERPDSAGGVTASSRSVK